MRAIKLKKRLKVTAILMVAICSNAAAKTIYVDNFALFGANNGSSWQNAYIYLHDALMTASTGDEIRVARGTYIPGQFVIFTRGHRGRMESFHLKNGVAIRGGYAGTAYIGNDIPDPNERDIELYETILSGDLNGDDAEISDPCDLIDEPTRADNCYHVVTSNSTDANTVLDGFTITGGNADGNEPSNIGSGLYILDSDMIVVNCYFHRNTSTSTGGAMYSSGGHPLLDSCLFECNHASGGSAIAYRWVNSKLINCTFMNNSSLYWGGAIGSYGQYIELVDCKFVNNTSGQSGGSFNNSGSSANLIGCEFIGNKSGDGGGAIVNQGCNANLTNCIFAGNSAKSKGGAISSRVKTNLNLTNCTFHRNSSDGPGGSLFNSYSNAAIKNCIMWDNFALNGTEISLTPFDYPSSASVAYSNIKNGISAIQVDDNCTIIWSDGNINADPLFAEPGYWADVDDPNITVEPNNPNAVWIDGDYHLKSQAGRYDPNSDSWVTDDVTSLCIDAGDPNSSTGDEPEPNGGRINMGTYGGTWQASKSYTDE